MILTLMSLSKIKLICSSSIDLNRDLFNKSLFLFEEVSMYDESSIKVLSNLDGIRQRPTMYIGGLGPHGIFQLLREAIDNGVDEYFAGRNNAIQVVLGNNKFIVADKGGGIPVGLTSVTDDRGTYTISTFTAIFTKMHAGGKFDNAAYKTSGGTHGVGVKTITALSTKLVVYTCYKRVWYTQTFGKGVALTELKKTVVPQQLLDMLPTPQKSGTILMWSPDQTILSGTLDYEQFYQFVEDSSLLNPGLSIHVKHGSNITEYLNKEGIQKYVEVKTNKLQAQLLTKVCTGSADNFDFAFGLTDSVDDNMVGYVNSIITADGGTHVDGFWTAFIQAVTTYKMRKHVFTPRDIRSGIVGLLNWRMSGSEFSGQTKNKLVSPIKNEVKAALQPVLDEWFAKNKTMARQIMDRATDIAAHRTTVKQITAAASNMRGKRGHILPGILSMATTEKDPERIELFIVEGDSAAGTAKYARYKGHQEVLLLKGKPLNVARKSLAIALGSEPVQHVLTAIGFDPKRKDHRLRVGKVFILADADVDGHHITSLVLTLLWMFCKQLFDEHRVYVVDGPLFMCRDRDKTYFGPTLKSIHAQTSKGIITRLKGWGELDPTNLRKIAFDPETRKLFRIVSVNGDKLEYYKKVVGEDTSVRKQILGIVE